MLKNEGDVLRKVIVCTPRLEYFKIDNLDAHNISQLPDRDKAIHQHDVLKSILEKSGCKVIDVVELRNHPNSVFVRDTAICTPKGYIKLRMGLESRRGEEEWMAEVLESVGESNAGSIKKPGTVEGGDVILAGSIAFVGYSSRTNIDGIKQISNLLKDMDYEIRTVKIPPPFLHLGGTMSVISKQCVLYCKDIFPRGFFKGFDKIDIPNSSFISGNVISLGNDRVIVESSNVEVAEKLEDQG
ncbi:MAG TPA: amidinotransferase, partial [Thermoplasmatales archaeon]|nr:amidinotransferase [Thermoplasmatales archaeon]